VDPGFPGVRDHDLWMRVKRLDASLKQVPAVEVIVRGELEQLAGGLPHHKLLVPAQSDVGGLAKVPDPRILLRVALANGGRAISGGVIRNDELEVLIGLTKQGLKGPGEELLAVVDREPDR